MRLDDIPEDATASDIVREANRLMGARRLVHRQVTTYSQDLGERLTSGFIKADWKAERHVVMALMSESDRMVDADEVREVEEAEVWPSREKFLRSYEWCRDDETASQMHGAYRVWMRAGDGRDLAIFRDGTAASFAMVWNDGRVAQIEDVATLEGYRRQGLSRRVMTRAVELVRSEGYETTFLIADEEDWPKDFYESLGFVTVGHHFTFVKRRA